MTTLLFSFALRFDSEEDIDEKEEEEEEEGEDEEDVGSNVDSRNISSSSSISTSIIACEGSSSPIGSNLSFGGTRSCESGIFG